MQNQKVKMFRILGKRGRVTIPYEIRQRVGFQYNDVLSFSESADGRTVTIKRERICDCPKAEPKGQKESKRADEVTLLEFLNTLSPEQQKAALYHLSMIQAERKNQED